jgi:hypothetical protein
VSFGGWFRRDCRRSCKLKDATTDIIHSGRSRAGVHQGKKILYGMAANLSVYSPSQLLETHFLTLKQMKQASRNEPDFF